MPINKSNIKPFACRVTRINGTRNKSNTSNLARKGFNILLTGAAILYNISLANYASALPSASTSLHFGIEATTSMTIILQNEDHNNLTNNSSVLSIAPTVEGSFGSQNINVLVGTSNETGYKLYMNSSKTTLDTTPVNGTTNSISAMPTKSGGYTENEFRNSNDTMNKWGYMIASTRLTANDDGYLPNYNPMSTSDIIINSCDKSCKDILGNNLDTTTISFGAKINNAVSNGTYGTTINFVAVANPLLDTSFDNVFHNVVGEDSKLNGYYKMQDMSAEICSRVPEPANGVVQTTTLIDARDQKVYNISKLYNDGCWMTQNLRITGTISATGSNFTGNDVDISAGDLTAGNSYDQPRTHIGTDSSGNPTVWYNYAAATAGTIIGNTANSTNASQDICPSNWSLPNSNESTNLINSITSNISTFSPVAGGFYTSGSSINSSTIGMWWGTWGGSNSRYAIFYNSTTSNFTTSGRNRTDGNYIRCIAKSQS